jgi:creatinine amidohydrolase
MYDVRAVASKAAEKEYAIVFPTYCFSQINEARSQPGTIAYSHELIWKVLNETCSELSRNGLEKIILLNGHGGNPRFLTFWLENQLSSPRDFEVVLFENDEPGKDRDPVRKREIKSLTKATLDGHAGESETSNMLYLYPELVDKDAINSESGADQKQATYSVWYNREWF